MIQLELNEYIEADDNAFIQADCTVESDTGLVCVDNNYGITEYEISYDKIIIAEVIFTKQELTDYYGEDTADKILNDISEYAINEFIGV